MYGVRYGGKRGERSSFTVADDLIAFRTRLGPKIDRAGGRYRDGKSPLYGYGRVDARRAVELAVAQGRGGSSARRTQRKRGVRRK